MERGETGEISLFPKSRTSPLEQEAGKFVIFAGSFEI